MTTNKNIKILYVEDDELTRENGVEYLENYFEHIGIFGYSDQKNAESFKLKNKINSKLIEKRKQIIADAQFQNVIKNNKNKVGKNFV